MPGTQIGASKYNMPTRMAAGADASGAANGAVTTSDVTAGLESPITWLAGIAAVTLGLVGLSVNFRVGKGHAAASVT